MAALSGTMAFQKASRGMPKKPKRRKRERQPSVTTRKGEMRRPSRLPANTSLMHYSQMGYSSNEGTRGKKLEGTVCAVENADKLAREQWQ